MNAEASSAAPGAARFATFGFMLGHPARVLALGFGSGLAPKAPGTAGTLAAWAAFVILSRWLDPLAWGIVIALGLVVGIVACTRCAQDLGIADPSSIVWDEVIAFWIILWVLMPASWLVQLAAFALFRYFDAAKPGPVRWADQAFKLRRGESIGWRQGFGIIFDDLVAALCTLLVLALVQRVIGFV